MVLLRVQVKFFVENPAALDLPAFVGIFHRWIQQNSVPGLLIDVADYKHVHEGPGILLIGHEGDYSLDMTGGRPGLLYTRKRKVDATLQDQLRQAFQLAQTAVDLIEAETPLRFKKDQAEIRFADRLLIRNEPATLDTLRPDLAAVLSEIYGDVTPTLSVTSTDPREVFTVRVQLSEVLQPQ